MRTSVVVGISMVVLVATAAIAAASTGGLPNLGKPKMAAQPLYKGYYDHHLDTYLITDTSSKTQAQAMHINYSPEIGKVKGLPLQYFVRGRAAAGQVTVFGSEPHEATYNPLWEEVWVTWKKGVKPVLLYRDDQINGLAKKGKLTVKDAHIVLNAPIVTIGKGG